MNIDQILSDLRSQRDAIDKAIAALDGTGGRGPGRRAGGRRRMSAAARARIAAAQRARWAKQKKSGSTKGKASSGTNEN